MHYFIIVGILGFLLFWFDFQRRYHKDSEGTYHALQWHDFEVKAEKSCGLVVSNTIKIPVWYDYELEDYILTPRAHELIQEEHARLLSVDFDGN